MRRIALLAVGVGLLAGAGDPKSDADDDRGRLQGSWTMASVVLNGTAVPRETAETGRLEVEGDRYVVTLGVGIASTFRIDTTTSPRQVDFTFSDGPQKGQTVRGIYEIDGNTYRLCRGLRPDVERPAKFDSPLESGLMLVVWRRAQRAEEGKETAIQKELERFEGAWRFDAVQVDGKDVPTETFKGVRLVLTGDRFTMIEQGATYGGS
jgi:uncharacterized protein (TIGR03067 family)